MRVAIQGELGSNSHMAALEVTGGMAEIRACPLSVEVFEALDRGDVEIAVLPIENSLHGSVAEHYDLLLQHQVKVSGEMLLRIRHHVLAAPGVRLQDLRRLLSHPVALSQCRRWLRDHPAMEAVPFYDTAGSVKHLMEQGARDCAAIAPELSARQYGAHVLVSGVEDHPQNYTRFYVLENATSADEMEADKLLVAFALEHRPGTLIRALETFQRAGLNLTRIESRPVPGKPWEYTFFVDLRFDSQAKLEGALEELKRECVWTKELGRYRAASIPSDLT